MHRSNQSFAARTSAISTVLTVALIFGILFPANAHAYIDPGTGSFVIQGIIAAVLGAGVVGKLFWHRIKAAFTGKSADDDHGDADE